MSLNTFLRRLILIGVFAVPFIPFIVSSSMFFPFITGKNFAFRIIVGIIFAAWAILAFKDASYRPKKSPVLMAFAFFIGVITLANVFGENPYRSFWSNYERMEGLIAHLHLFAYFLVATSVLTAEKLWHRFFYTSFGVNLAVIVFSFFQLAGKLPINQGGVRVDATFGNTTYLAVYLLFNVFLLAFYLLRTPSSDSGNDRAIFPLIGAGIGSLVVAWSLNAPFYAYFLSVIGILIAAFPLFLFFRALNGKIFLWFLLLADIFVIYRTETRGAILGLLGGALVSAALITFFNRQNKTVRNWAAGAMAGILILAGVFIAIKDSEFVRQNSTLSRFASISLIEATTKSRFMVWNMSYQGFKENPVLGWGQDNFIVVFGKYYNPGMWGQEPWFDRSHNVFFDWLIAGGALGLLSYLSLFGAAVYMLWRSRNFSIAEKSIFSGLFAGYFFQNLFVFDNLTSYIMFFSVLGLISVLGRNEVPIPQKNSAQTPISSSGAHYLFTPAILAAFVLVFYFANVKPAMASRYLIRALSGHQEGVSKNLEYFKKVFELDTFGSGEAREQLIQTAVRLKTTNAPEELKKEFFVLAGDQMLAQIKKSPADVRYELYLGSFLGSFGAYDEAIKHLSRARELSPKKQQILFELGSVYINKGEPAKGLAYLKEAYDYAPEYEEAASIYAAGLIYARQTAEADALLKETYGTVLVSDDRIIGAYFAKGMYERVISIRKNDLEKSPDDQQARLSLALAYLQSGEREGAIRELQEVIRRDSSFKEEGEYYISEIRAGRNP